ncbi:MAG: transcriptional regulator [Chloroflexota bacterium]|nr:transcriptional regulator [Chloroflexota bacterium]
MHPRTLYALRDRGLIEPLSRGLYRLTALPPLGEPDLIAVTRKVPRGVVCLISALVYHDLTTQIPHAVHLALERGAERPRLDYPPVEVYWFSRPAFRAGIEEVEMDGVTVRIYDAEKTVADCFKFRNRIGMDVTLEALRSWRARRERTVDRLLHYARVDRVERVIWPYLEALA